MAKSKKGLEEQLSNIRKNIKNYAIDVAVNVATQIRDELTETAISAMEKFYEYEPKYYQRHWEAHNFINRRKSGDVRSIKKYYVNAHNNMIYGGVLLSPDADAKQYKPAMLDVYGSAKYPAPPHEVFDLVMHGFHGPASYGLHVYNSDTMMAVKRMIPTPLDIVYKKRDSIIKNIDKYIKQAQRGIGKRYGF